jgi:hypothetical protein
VALTGGRIEANLVDEADSESAGFVFSSKCEGHASAGTIPLPLP